MQTLVTQEGDTWESIAESNSVPLSSLLAANGFDPNSCDAPPDAGSTVAIPDSPPTVAAAPGEDHSLDLPAESCLWVRLDMSPSEAAYTADSLRLYDDGGAHDVTLAISEHFTPNGDSVDVLFDAVDPNLSYTIDYLTEDGDTISIATSTAFSELNDDALPDAADDPPESAPVDLDGRGDRTLPPADAGDAPADGGDASPTAIAGSDLPGSGASLG